MFIIKFNNMIRNKWIWGTFAIIVAVAFAGSDLLSGRSQGGDTRTTSAGFLDGKPVSRQEYSEMRRAVSVESEHGQENFAFPERETWKRLAAMKAVNALGLTVSNDDLVKVIQADPAFHDETGTFSPMLFKFRLQSAGFSPTEFEEMFRKRIALDRLHQAISTAVWVPSAILTDRVHGYADSFTLCTAVLSNSFDAVTMELTDEEVKNFYDRNQERYREPDQRQVVYTVFKASDYRDLVEVAEDEVLDFYDANVVRYLVKDAEDVESVQPFEEVRQSIEEELASAAAQDLAYRDALDFSDIFFTNRNAKLTFEMAAASQGLSVLTSRLFTATSYPVHADTSRAFTEAAFALEPDSPVNRFSEAVNGGIESYVMCFHTNVASYITPLDRIVPRVRASAQMEAADHAFLSELDTVVEAFAQGGDAGLNFREIAMANNMVVSTNFVFTLMDAYGETDVPSAHQVASAMAGMSAGDVVKTPVPIVGGVLFFQVVDRVSGDATMYSAIKNQTQGAYFSDMTELLWEDWLEQNLLSRKPTDLIVPLDLKSGDEDDEDEFE